MVLVRHKRLALPLGMLALGAGFKEGAWWQGALAMGALGRLDVAAASLGIYVVHAGISAGLHATGELAWTGKSSVGSTLPEYCQTAA